MKKKNIVLSFFALSFLIFSCSTPKSKTATNKNTSSTASSSLDFLKSYEINNSEYGTKTKVTVSEDYRTMKTNGMPNHPTGNFPNAHNPNSISEQDMTYKLPLKPQFSGEAKFAREPGVALNGVRFAPGTAERFVCESGEVYRIEAIQDIYNLGLDDNHAHVQPTGAYHYHSIPKGLVKVLDKGEDIILVGFAADGFPMYYSVSGKYKPAYRISKESRTGDVCAYETRRKTEHKELANTSPDGLFVSDWVFDKSIGNLDECNGTEINGEYAYFVTEEYPYVSRCFKGEFTERRPSGPPPGGHRGGGRGNRNHPHGH